MVIFEEKNSTTSETLKNFIHLRSKKKPKTKLCCSGGGGGGGGGNTNYSTQLPWPPPTENQMFLWNLKEENFKLKGGYAHSNMHIFDF